MTFRRVIWFLLATHSLLVSWIPTAFCVSRSEHDYDFHSQPITERFQELGALTNSTGSQFGFENPGLKRLRLEAELGKAQAQFLLGSCYLEGRGVRQDFTEALAWFTKAADQGISEAACSIGLLYQRRGTNDDVEAAQWFEKAVRRSNEHGRFHLGMCYLLGRGVQQNNAEAMELIQEAAEKGLEEAIIMLGRCYLYGNGTKKDPAEGKRWLLKGAETGSVQAQHQLGLLHDFGLDGETNVVEALRWYRKAATNSFPKAQAVLGRVLLNRGNANDFSEAIMWLRKAADQGEISGLLYLGVAHHIGRGVPQSHLEAARFYRMAAERGDIEAQAELGGILLSQGATNDFSEGIMWLRRAADKGDAGALYNLGNAYHNGRGVPQIRSEAVKYFRMAAERGLVQAQEALAGCYLKGYGVESNIVEALKWYRKAATNSFPKAQAVLGGVLLERGTTNDFGEAVMWLRKAADKGEASGLFSLGVAYHTGRGVPQSNSEAVRFVRMAAERGDIKAQALLGALLLGQGATNDLSEAVMWLRKAADRGEVSSMSNLGKAYHDGRGVPQSDSESARFYRMAAERGDIKAQAVIGAILLYGGTTNDFGEAVMWLRKAADKGEVSALYNLGVAYVKGSGVPQSDSEAARFYRMAAERGDIEAQAELGALLLGQGATNDLSEAVIWLRKSADQGEASALYNLGVAYQKGLGVPQSDSGAAMYFRMAAERGDIKAQKILAGLTMQSDVALGPTNIALPQGVALQVPPNCRFYYAQAARKLLGKGGQPLSTNIVGLLTPERRGWFLVLQFLPVGYVNDTDQAIDYEKALDCMEKKEGALIAWQTKPAYDSHSKLLHYAVSGEAAGVTFVNRGFGLLGRKGVLFVMAVYRSESDFKSDFDLARVREIIDAIEFMPGERYSDYKDGDRISSAGLSEVLWGRD